MTQQIAISSGEQAASALIFTGKCAITGIQIIGDGSADPKVIVDDSIDGSGVVKAEVSDDVSVSGEVTKYVPFANPVEMLDGIYATVSGSNATYIIEYFAL